MYVYLDFEKGLVGMFGALGEEGACQINQFPHSTLFSLCFSCLGA